MKRFPSCLRIAIALILGVGSVGGMVAYADVGVPFNGWLQLNSGYAQVPYQDEINLTPANGSFTIEGWIKNPSFTDLQNDAIYKKSSFKLGFKHDENIFPLPGHSTYSVLFWACSPATGGEWCFARSGHVLSDCVGSYCPPQGWFHFAYVYNQATGKGSLFWNGRMLGADESIPNVSMEPIALHSATSMDEFRISNSARYTATFTPASAPFECDGNTQALWHFNEIAGTTTFHDVCGTVDNMLVGYNGAHTEGVPGSWVYLPLVVR